MTRALAVIVASALSANCATGAYVARQEWGGERGGVAPSNVAPRSQDPPAVTAAYAKGLPVGSKVTVRLIDGPTLKATLLVVESTAIVVRPRTRLPEPARRIPFEQIVTIEPDRENGVVRAIAIGAAVGAGAAIGVLLALAALLSD